jgi:hypothetical protein
VFLADAAGFSFAAGSCDLTSVWLRKTSKVMAEAWRILMAGVSFERKGMRWEESVLDYTASPFGIGKSNSASFDNHPHPSDLSYIALIGSAP